MLIFVQHYYQLRHRQRVGWDVVNDKATGRATTGMYNIRIPLRFVRCGLEGKAHLMTQRGKSVASRLHLVTICFALLPYFSAPSSIHWSLKVYFCVLYCSIRLIWTSDTFSYAGVNKSQTPCRPNLCPTTRNLCEPTFWKTALHHLPRV
jgi:hypothetical protein